MLASGAESTFDYVTDIGTHEDGTFVMNSWQTTPGAFFYTVRIWQVNTWESNHQEEDTAGSDQLRLGSDSLKRLVNLKRASDGAVYMVSGRGDLNHPYYMSREQGWVVDDQLVIDDQLYELLDTAKTMVDEGLMMDSDPQGEEYFAAMNSDEVMGYSLPTWGMHFWLKPNADETAGNWRMVTGPVHTSVAEPGSALRRPLICRMKQLN
ncbi:MAG: hypothetical protein U5K84_04160 [Alkalibacterium sp.]|nr:hypothetical protein [Alkalibacterium sp.]